jgi:anti-sigma-K factor RskA
MQGWLLSFADPHVSCGAAPGNALLASAVKTMMSPRWMQTARKVLAIEPDGGSPSK